MAPHSVQPCTNNPALPLENTFLQRPTCGPYWPMTTRKTRSATAAASVDQPEAAAAPPTSPPAPPAQPSALIIEEDSCAPPQPYDPADYRWVPVRRRARYDGWTEEKQRRFIEALADTGQVGLAATAVGMSREAAYKMRRQPHAAAFAKAWDAARAQAGAFIEDVAFERALAGIEHPVFDEFGQVVATRRVYNDRLLMFLLRSLKPERYARHALVSLAATIPDRPAEAELAQRLTALEPELPAPPEELFGAETLAGEFEIADIADGQLPGFLSEQRPDLPPELAEYARVKAAYVKWEAKEQLSTEEYRDVCVAIDPTQRNERRRIRHR